VTLFSGPAGARAAYAAAALLPGVPLLYNGQEVESPQKLGLFAKEAIDWNRPGADSARTFYRRVVELAREHPALAGSEVQAVATSAPQDVIAYLRGGRVLVLVNARNRPVTLSIEGRPVAGARDLLSGAVQQGETVRLAAYQPLVLELRR
jgi:glycosidase